MSHGTYTLCSFCSQTTVITDRDHKCTEKFYSLITKIIQVKQVNEDHSFLDHITNLVFQGGGVKGIAYLGALKELQGEGKAKRRNVLSGIKRIAGTSAGSIVALYLGLNLDVKKDIQRLMEKEYSALLDDGLVLKVTTNPGVFKTFENYKDFKVKDIVLEALDHFASIGHNLNFGTPQEKRQAEEDLRKATRGLLRYLGRKAGFFPALILKFKGSSYAADATTWLVNLLKSSGVKQTSNIYYDSIKQSPAYTAGQSLLNNFLAPQIETLKRAAKRPVEIDLFRNEVSSYAPDSASTGISEDSLFDDILNEECSAFLFEPDQLELSLSADPALRSEAQYNSGGYTTQDILRNTNVRRSDGIATEPYLSTQSYQYDQVSSTYTPNYPSTTTYQSYQAAPYPSTTTYQSYQTAPYPSTTTYQSYQVDSIVGSTAQNSGSNPNLYDELRRRENQGESFKRAAKPTVDIERREERPGLIPISQTNELKASLIGGSPAHIESIVREFRRPDQEKYMPVAISINVEMSARESEICKRSVASTPLLEQSNRMLIQETIIAQEMPTEKQTKTALEMESEEFIKRSQSKIDAAPKKQLTNDILPYALGEVLWFSIVSQRNATGLKEKLGLFKGSVVYEELIEDPIADRLIELGLEKDKKKNITFKELMDYNVLLPEEKKFKKFYVTAFNTVTSKTEVFSEEHTPNVVIADAVRASMSIPIFFTPVKIQEKTESGGLKPRTCFNGFSRDEVNYMDGGILDNYPMWIFDDIKYCFDESFQIPSNMRCSIQNPHTLGFRLLDVETIQRYTTPTEKVLFAKEDKKFEETFSYQMGLLAGAFMSGAQENEHLKRGDYTRSVYVNNLGVSAIKFRLSPQEKENLIASGRQSVENYLKRAGKNFKGEGQLH